MSGEKIKTWFVLGNSSDQKMIYDYVKIRVKFD